MIIAIDPGSEKSAMVVWLDDKIAQHEKWNNVDLLSYLAGRRNCYFAHLYIEQIASYGMAVGAEIFETCVWTGRFMEAFGAQRTIRVPRLKIKLHHCHDSKAKDANIRAALIDRFGGKDRALGCKKSPGPLYGIAGDEWAALALALYAHDTQAARLSGGMTA